MNCQDSSGRRRSLSESALSPIELHSPSQKDYIDPQSRFAVPLQDVSLKVLSESESLPSAPLTSLKKVIFK